MPELTQSEISKYWQIFQGQQPVNGRLTGNTMFALLKNSQLPDNKLEKIWDLADIDGDGTMDFEEFCIAMRLVFDILKGDMPDVPATLPQWLVPGSKQHLVGGSQPSGIGAMPQRSSMRDDDDDTGLSSDFNWYISPDDRRAYDSVYSVNSDSLGKVSFDSLSELYRSLDGVPDTDISSAWNLVNPRSDEKIDKEQCIVFLHILNNRSKGVRVPRGIPSSLRASFGKDIPAYDVNSRQSEIRRPLSSRGSFAEGYLSRMGLGGKSQGYQSRGTDFSGTKDTDWEEVRLKRELNDIEDKIKKLQSREGRSSSSNSSSVVKRELQQLLEYKENQLHKKRSGHTSSGSDLSRSEEEISLLAEQMDALRQHYSQKSQELQNLKSELASL